MIKDCYAIHKGVMAKDKVEVIDILTKVSLFLKRERVKAYKLFQELDVDANGKLDAGELAVFFRR